MVRAGDLAADGACCAAPSSRRSSRSTTRPRAGRRQLLRSAWASTSRPRISSGVLVQRAEGPVLLVAAAAPGRRRPAAAARIGARVPAAGRRSSLRSTPTSSRAGGTGSSAAATGTAASSTSIRSSRSASRRSSRGARGSRGGGARPRQSSALAVALSVFQMLQVPGTACCRSATRRGRSTAPPSCASDDPTSLARVIARRAGAALRLAYLRDPPWLLGMESGFRAWENTVDGTRVRWIGGHASFFVPADAASFVMPVRTTFASTDDSSGHARVTVDDRAAAVAVLASPGWQQ